MTTVLLVLAAFAILGHVSEPKVVVVVIDTEGES